MIAGFGVTSSFVGREQEMSELIPLLRSRETRLLTLTGVGGSGKTRLAIELADAVETCFGAGVCLVEMAPLEDPADIPAAVAKALGLREPPGVALPLDIVARFLQPREVLLLLDNCEHLLAASAELVRDLLRSCPDLHILCTSRQALGVVGESVWVVPPLAVPAPNASFASIAATGAVRLFVERGRLQQTDFSSTPGNAGAIVEICRQIEGLPLAVELAAAWLRLLPVTDLAVRISASLNLLSSTDRRGPARHQTLRAAIDWSYGMLSDAEQMLFRRLGVFTGGFSVESAEAVCASADGVPSEGILELLAQLLEKSLVEREYRAGEVRLRLLEPLRQYAIERLQAGSEWEALRERHAQWCLVLAEEQESRFRGPQQKRAFECLEREYDNLRSALRWAEGHGEIALRLVAALQHFWFSRTHFSEGRRWLDGVLAATAGLRVPARAAALNSAAYLAWRSGAHAEIFANSAEALALSQGIGDSLASAVALHFTAAATMEQGDLVEAARLHEQSLALLRDGRHTWWVALGLGHLAIVRQLQGDAAAAGGLVQESLTLFRQTGDNIFTAHALDVVGLGWEQQGDLARAAGSFREALALYDEQDEHSGIAVALMRLASLAATQGQWQRAAGLLGSKDAVLQRESPLPLFYQAYGDSLLARVREALDEHTFARAWAAGESMPLAAAIQVAQADAPEQVERQAPPAPDDRHLSSHGVQWPENLDGLSRRELEVLRLLAAGNSNKQIGRALSLSVRTVERHVANVYLKIGAHGRAGATTYAHRRGLAPPD